MSRRTAGGVTLIDVFFVVLVIMLAVIPAVGILTYTWQSSKRTHQMATAVFCAQRAINDFLVTFQPARAWPVGFPDTVMQLPTVSLDGTPYVITETFHDASDGPEMQADGQLADVPLLVDIVVSVSYPGSSYPVTASTRVFKHAIAMELP